MLAQCAANQITWSGRFKYVIFGNWVYFLRYERKLKVDQDFYMPGIMYSGENDSCVVTQYVHRTS